MGQHGLIDRLPRIDIKITGLTVQAPGRNRDQRTAFHLFSIKSRAFAFRYPANIPLSRVPFVPFVPLVPLVPQRL